MSYQGIRQTEEGLYVRFRVKGEVREYGPYPTAAEAIAAHSALTNGGEPTTNQTILNGS
jgi:hypothetical protein